VLVPIQCEYYALEGLSQLIHTINLVKEQMSIKYQLFVAFLPCNIEMLMLLL
jgi:cellulose biosynthesis protein BcsQ